MTKKEIEIALAKADVKFRPHLSKKELEFLYDEHIKPVKSKKKSVKKIVREVKEKVVRYVEERKSQFVVKFVENVRYKGKNYNIGRVLKVSREMKEELMDAYEATGKSPVMKSWDPSDDHLKYEIREDVKGGVKEYKKGETYDLRDIPQNVKKKLGI